jgi:hypothetical protein
VAGDTATVHSDAVETEEGTMTKKRARELRKTISDAQTELYEAEQKRRRATNAKTVGKCFAYRNSYGDGEEWWLYLMITGIDDNGCLQGIQLQHTANDSVEFKSIDWMGWPPSKADGYQPISHAIFNQNYTRLLALLKRRHTAAIKLQGER